MKKHGLINIIVLCLMVSSIFPATAQEQQDSLAQQSRVFNHQFIKQQIVPLSFVGAGLLTLGNNELFFNKHEVKEERDHSFLGFHDPIDNFLAVAPIGVNYGLDLLKVPARDDFLNQTLILAKSEVATLGVVYILKYATHERRPDNSDYRSFPSGHTAEAFLAATFLDKEFRSASPWISVAGYTMATATGALRILNNKHWIGDVLVGAGVGMLTTNIIFATHQYRWSNKPDALSIHIIPLSFDGRPGFTASIRF